ncbi:PREDICTED: aspartate-rich protein 1-like isoform X2 [Cercocebus atys]|uniref:aspartate-rich protein 1-like isoform X2 n=1 Tax=Cercocebus atys TaxID=9531 RepID=UPI0005F51551|nr:PREDICTED: aspartate-rich protein 1-like isoform X2 [Cercocebus atys]XP_011913963.1 PREDICTED: aspartate-rich protein 1-like isoform X2 [Cercocebus atys]
MDTGHRRDELQNITAVAAATSESTTVEPGKLDVGATEDHDLQHISNQKMPTGPREGSLSLKSLPPSEEDYDDAQILPSPIQGSSEENLNLVCPPPSEADDWDDDEDYYIIEILPLSDQGTYLELTHFLRNKLSGFNI